MYDYTAQTGARRAGGRNNLFKQSSAVQFGAARSNCHNLALLFGTFSNVLITFMHAAARFCCIFLSKIFENHGFCFGLCRWSANCCLRRDETVRPLFQVNPCSSTLDTLRCCSGRSEAGSLEMPAVAQSRNPLWGFQNVTPPAQKNSGCSSPFNRACLSPPSIHAMDAPICTLAHLKS